MLAPVDAGTRFVAVARPQSWVRVLSHFVPGNQGPGVGVGRVWAQQVFDDGGFSVDIPLWDGGSVVGVPVAAANEAGEVGVAWPLLEQGMPQLRFTVLFARDGGPVPVDAGATGDAGQPVDGGTPDAGVRDDGGMPADAGVAGDAGTAGDGGIPAEVDAGVLDGGSTENAGVHRQDAGEGAQEPVLFIPVSCGCSHGGTSVWLMGLLSSTMARRRLARARRDDASA
jgi:hypothetical protein